MSDSSQPAPISKQRLQEARRLGYTPRSPELTAGVVLLTAAWIGQICLPALSLAFRDLMESGLRSHPATELDLAAELQPAVFQIGRELLRIGAACWAAAFVADLAQVGFVWSPVALLPHGQRISPVAGLARILSWPTLERASLLSLKVLVSVVGVLVVADLAARSLFATSEIPAAQSLTLWSIGVNWVSVLLAGAGGCCLLSGVVDAWIRKQRWKLSIEKTDDECRRGD